MGSRASLTRALQWKLRIRRNTLHHRGPLQLHRTSLTLTRITRPGPAAVTALNSGMCGRRQRQRSHSCDAPVQSSPLRAIWSRTIHCMATSNRIAHNWGVTKAREVIPQPTPQPNTSKETRRCWQRAVGPCPAQTFFA